MSEVFNSSATDTFVLPQSPFDTNRAERGNSSFDFPNLATVYMLYDLPWYKNQQGWLGRLLGGYSINPTWRYSSGQPYTIIELQSASTRTCDPSRTFSRAFSDCRPFLANPSASLDTVGKCTSSTLADCGLVNFFTGDATTSSAVHWIFNNLTADKFFGTPFSSAGRNTQRGQTIDQVNLSVLKDTKVNERLTVQLRAVLYNAFNRQFRGVPDNIINDGRFDPTTFSGSFGNNFFNSDGGSSVNTVFNGIGKRRMEVGLKLIF